MALQIVPYTANIVTAVCAFNERMARADAPSDFLLPLPDALGRETSTSQTRMARTQYLAVEGESVRGGVAVVEQPTWLNGRIVTTCNYQAPLSEGIIDHRYGFVALQMLKSLQRQSPLAFAVGMGGEQNPLPRLLKALGWTIRPVPFLFRISNVRRVLSELAPLRTSSTRRIAARTAAATGAGWIAIRALQSRALVARRRFRAVRAEPVDSWGSWADALWEPQGFPYSFAVARDYRTLTTLYPLGDDRTFAYRVREGEATVGWAACLKTKMHAHKDFGNLTVATVLDCSAAPAYADTVAAAVADALTRAGADLVVTNQSHTRWVKSFRGAGFLSGPSNYLFATSRALTEEIGQAGGHARVHVTRGDGDGRIHL
jgi:hypothetical protein